MNGIIEKKEAERPPTVAVHCSGDTTSRNTTNPYSSKKFIAAFASSPNGRNDRTKSARRKFAWVKLSLKTQTALILNRMISTKKTTKEGRHTYQHHPRREEVRRPWEGSTAVRDACREVTAHELEDHPSADACAVRVAS